MYQHANDQDDLHFTSSRAIHLLGDLVPQIHLTLFSILQGLAFVFLLTSIQLPSSITIQNIWAAILVHHFYLSFVASLLIITFVWDELVYATIFLHWPVTSWTTLLQMLLSFCEIGAFSNTNKTDIWLFFTGLAFIVGYFTRRRNSRITSKELLVQNERLIERVKSPFTAWYFVPLGIVCVALAFIRPMGLVNSSLFDLLVPLLLGCTTLLILKRDTAAYTSIMNGALNGTQYHILANGAIDADPIFRRALSESHN